MADLFSLAGQNVLITGATRGIGAACALALARAGSPHILLVQRDRSNTTTYDALLALSPAPRVDIIEADLSNLDDARKIVPRALQLATELHVLVNCAGIQRRHPATEFPENDWDEVRPILSSLPLPHTDGSLPLTRSSPSTSKSPGSSPKPPAPTWSPTLAEKSSTLVPSLPSKADSPYPPMQRPKARLDNSPRRFRTNGRVKGCR